MKSEFLYLHHIRERCQRVVGCVEAGREAFFANLVYQDAVMRNLEIISRQAHITRVACPLGGPAVASNRRFPRRADPRLPESGPGASLARSQPQRAGIAASDWGLPGRAGASLRPPWNGKPRSSG